MFLPKFYVLHYGWIEWGTKSIKVNLPLQFSFPSTCQPWRFLPLSSNSSSVKPFDVKEAQFIVHWCRASISCPTSVSAWTWGRSDSEVTFRLFLRYSWPRSPFHLLHHPPEFSNPPPLSPAHLLLTDVLRRRFHPWVWAALQEASTSVCVCVWHCVSVCVIVPAHLSPSFLPHSGWGEGCFSPTCRGRCLPSTTMDLLPSFSVLITRRLCFQAAGQKLPDTVVERLLMPIYLKWLTQQWHSLWMSTTAPLILQSTVALKIKHSTKNDRKNLENKSQNRTFQRALHGFKLKQYFFPSLF